MRGYPDEAIARPVALDHLAPFQIRMRDNIPGTAFIGLLVERVLRRHDLSVATADLGSCKDRRNDR